MSLKRKDNTFLHMYNKFKPKIILKSKNLHWKTEKKRRLIRRIFPEKNKA